MQESPELVRDAADTRGAVIEAGAVGKTYRAAKNRSVEALADISLSIRDGEFLSVVGPSGCGKSTFLTIVAGLVPASTGTIATSARRLKRFIQPPAAARIIVRQRPQFGRRIWRAEY